MKNSYYIGFDIGSDTVHSIVLNQGKDIVYSPKSLMHFGNPVDTLKIAYSTILKKIKKEEIKAVAFTGSAGRLIADITNNPYYYDTISIPAGTELISPDAEYIFHMGSTDPYFFEKVVEKDASFVADHGTGTKCGGGSGILINKQVRRFFTDECKVKLTNDKIKDRELLQKQLEDIHKKAFESISNASKDIDVGGRCGVVIQSDMIHLQNSGEQIQNILKGMYKRIAKNYKSDVIKTRHLENKYSIATGGVFFNKFILKALEEQLEIKINLPENYEKVGAIGAAFKALKENKESKFNIEDLELVAEAQKQEINFAPALSTVLDKVKSYNEEEAIKVEKGLFIFKKYSGDVVIGLDGGSTTTKAIIADMDLNIIAEICLDTDGKPLETAQKMFGEIRKHLDINIRAIAYTGSSGAFYHKLFTDFKIKGESADIVKDEITCHARGVKHFNNKVDTIFECGGQDAKFTLFNKDGTVKKAKMNLSCMAGTGQSMKNMLDMLGFDFESFKKYALAAKRTPVADETCAIFTEAGILRLIALGFPKEEIAAAIAYGFMGGYANKFVGNEKFGKFASAQGGPFKGMACLAALALHTGIEVHAFPHRQLFGALGAAICARDKANNVCKFRGLEIADMNFEKRVDNCSKIIKDNCSIRDCQLQIYNIGEDTIYSGGLCPKGNTDFSIIRAPDYVAQYKKILEKHLDKFTKPLYQETENERVLIPRSLTFLNEKGVFYTALYNNLGFDVAISPESDDHIANLGVAYAHSETCYPIKLAHGHVALLKQFKKDKDKILLVNILSSEKEKYKFCPYVAAAGFLTKDALHLENSEVLLPVIYFNDPHYKIEDAIKSDLDRINKKFSKKQIKEAIKKAQEAEREFLDEIYNKGDEIINRLKDKKIYIGIGRGYTILDNKASSKVHELFASYGLNFIPSFFIRPPEYKIDEIVDNMYWYQGQSIIKYNLLTAMNKNFYPVRETNFNCGTDSILVYHEEDIMKIAEKPHLVLQTDGHNSNAQFGTRILANSEVVKENVSKEIRLEDFKKKGPEIVFKKIIGVPYMGDGSMALAAAFRAFGYKSEVMPTHTRRSQIFAKKYVSTNTCRPFSFQIGDALAWLDGLKQKGIDPNKDAVIFEPKAKGPCRQGQYYVMLRSFFDKNGFSEVPIISPDADEDYTNVPMPKSTIAKLSALSYKGIFCNDLLYDALLRTRPYEKEKGSADLLYETLCLELYELIEKRVSNKEFVEFIRNAKNRYEVLLKTNKRKPFVIVNGEIFVRCHTKANQDSIKLLEKYGLEIILTPPSQWIEYVNKLSVGFYKKTNEWYRFATSLAKKWYMRHISKKLRTPFEEYLIGREGHDPAHIIDAPQKALVYEKLIGGEAPLSIGEAFLFTKGKLDNICGIYHVGPFGCMQETVATSKINSIIQRHRKETKNAHEKIIPFMDAVFGDSELPNLEAEIAAFAEKCYLKKELIS